MSPRDRFQYDVATGRWTLPVASLVALAAWTLMSGSLQADWGALLCAAAMSYLLVELNTQFMLIRTRTVLPSCMYLCLFASIPFLHQWSVACLLPVFFVCMLFAFFRSYESYHASVTIFHAFFFLGLCSLVYPPVSWLFPLLFLHMVFLRSFNAKTFFAGFIGMLVPYWLILGYGLFVGNFDVFERAVLAPFGWEAPRYADISLQQGVAYGTALLLFVAYVAFYSLSAYRDKVQTRILLKTMIWMGAWGWGLLALRPQDGQQLLPVIFVPIAFLVGRLYALSFGLYVRISFYVTLALVFSLFLFGLWMRLFNF